MPDQSQIVINPENPITNVHTQHSGIVGYIVRGNIDSDLALAFYNSSLQGPLFLCDSNNIDNSLILQENEDNLWWEQIGDFSEEYSSIDPENQPDDSDPYYLDDHTRSTTNIENTNTLDELLRYISSKEFNSSDYFLILNTNVFSGEEFATFPFLLMSEYASYEITPVICFIINGKPCYAVRPDKIKTMSATTPILKEKGEALVRIIDINNIENILESSIISIGKINSNTGND